MNAKQSVVLKRLLAIVLMIAMVFTGSPFGIMNVQAAATRRVPVLKQSDYRYMLVGTKYAFDIANKISDSDYKWSSSNKSVATVSKKGVVKAVKEGTATITCKITSTKGNYTLTATVYVKGESKKPASSVTISNKIGSMLIGESYDFDLAYPTKDTSDFINWSTSNPNIATVNEDGMVTVLRKGTFTIKATALNGKVSDKVTITATANASVANQAELERALAVNNAGEIRINTKEQEEFVIPKGNYKNTRLVVNALNASIKNSGVFKEIEIRAMKEKAWEELAKGNVVKLYSDAAIIVENGAELNVWALDEGVNAGFEVNGSLKLSAKAACNINIKGAAGSVPEVVVTADDVTIDTELAINLEATKKVTLVLADKEAANTTVKVSSKDVIPVVKGDGKVKVDVNGTIVEVGEIKITLTPTESVVHTTSAPNPTKAPTTAPTQVPTATPTVAPTAVPTQIPTIAPTAVPTETPTIVPTAAPTVTPVPVNDNGLDSEGRMVANFGSPVIDGEIDEVWDKAVAVSPLIASANTDVSAVFKVLWDDNAIYILAKVKDSNLSVQSGDAYQQDSIEIFMDENDDKTKDYGSDDLHFRVNYENMQTVDKGDGKRFYTAAKVVDDGYLIEARIAFQDVPQLEKVMGFDLQVNVAEGNSRSATLNVFDRTGSGWNNTAVFGDIILAGRNADDVSGLNPYDLMSLIAIAEKMDVSGYYNGYVVTECIAAAKAVLADENATQADIDEQYERLSAAISELRISSNPIVDHALVVGQSIGDTVTLTADQDLEWTVADPSVAELSEVTGKTTIVTFKGKGRTTVTATAADGNTSVVRVVVEDTIAYYEDFEDNRHLVSKLYGSGSYSIKANMGQSGNGLQVTNYGTAGGCIFLKDSTGTFMEMAPGDATVAGKSYYVAFAVKLGSALLKEDVQLKLFAGKDGVFSYVNAQELTTVTATNDSWTLVEAEFTLPEDINYCRVGFLVPDGAGEAFYVDDVVIMEIDRGPVLITKETLNKSELKLSVGNSYVLEAELAPWDTTANTAITFTSADPTVAAVDENGTVTAVSAGTTTITAATTNETITGQPLEATCTVTVLDNIELWLNRKVIAFNSTSDQYQLVANTDDMLTYTSSDEEVAEVSQTGLITAVSEGVATITASAGAGNEYECTVYVNKNMVQYLDFEEEETYTVSGTAKVVEDEAYSGVKSLYLTPDQNYRGLYWQYENVTTDKQSFHVSAYVKAEKGTKLRFLDTDNGWSVLNTIEANGEWQLFSTTVTLAAGAKTCLRISPYDDENMVPYYVDCFYVAKEASYISLYQTYADLFKIGVAISDTGIQSASVTGLVKKQYNSITPENSLKPEILLNQTKSKETGEVSINENRLDDYCKYAIENGLLMRGHTLVWHSQTPKWLFCEGFNASNAYVSKEVMDQRLESYIKTIMDYCKTNYPGVIYAWDVCNEVVSAKGNPSMANYWHDVYGDYSYVADAFKYARQYAEEGTKLYYNDYNCYQPGKAEEILSFLEGVKAAGNIDGIGMQSHLSIGYPSVSMVTDTIDKFAAAGYDVQITELDIGVGGSKAPTAEQSAAQAEMYGKLFEGLVEKADKISSVTFWGVSDDVSWRTPEEPLIYDSKLNEKDSYYKIIAAANKKIELDYDAMIARSLLSAGNNYRFKQVLAKAVSGGAVSGSSISGSSITVAYIGGSITEGANSEANKTYAALSYQAFLDTFHLDSENVNYVNAGISGTSSALGIIRYERDVAVYEPDVVFIEFAVNDYQEPTGGEAYESLIREILASENHPAVVLVFSVFKSGYTMQETYKKLGEKYNLPMISISDAILPEINDNHTLTEDEFFSDLYHPTDYGHQIMADCIKHLFETWNASEEDVDVEIPEDTVFGNSYEGMKMIENDTESVIIEKGGFDTVDTAVLGYRYNRGITFAKNWKHDGTSSNESFVMTMNGKNLMIAYKQSSNSNAGSVDVYVDGVFVKTIDSYSNGAYNNPLPAVIFNDEAAAEHVVEIKMHAGDEGKEFTILAFGYTE
ncbi:MAG: hypothetical protein E7256_00560 [Lachnospiraceae bacterium]|nr:hypothetical protein [Lachnospiraceae bacterium]